MVVWTLKPPSKKGCRFLKGHPWVFSNELAHSPKGISPGEPIELRDVRGKFFARGYGNPNSLIAFRCLTREESAVETSTTLENHLWTAWEVRRNLGFSTETGFRLCFAEADNLPGVVIDGYPIVETGNWVWVAQLNTAGSDPWAESLKIALEKISKKMGLESIAILLRKDAPIRKYEGVLQEAPQFILGKTPDVIQTRVRSSTGTIELEFDLLHGQKTGLFLDQTDNALFLLKILAHEKPKKILDLFSYVGAWSAHLQKDASDSDFVLPEYILPEYILVDASQKSLEFGQINLSGSKVQTVRLDILEKMHELEKHLPHSQYDVVIVDPPALIKSRSHLKQGEQTYFQLFMNSLKLVKPGGFWIPSSCSGLLSGDRFNEIVQSVAEKLDVRLRSLGRGMQSLDHPVVSNFPEGNYLKTGFFQTICKKQPPQQLQ